MNLLDESYLTAREVAQVFRITKHTVYSWIKSGDLTAVQVGGIWRIPQSQFDRGDIGTRLGAAREEKADD